ncbi:FAM126B [Cordylochernes scorpioides]|uniref:FAM126B n=1 Tax=Cordylochernes scorpioides TaxID=51811 RepID=A0ABY6KEJ3_9ARAC|nr:FAM126B [Cordylochernes scorpioides]
MVQAMIIMQVKESLFAVQGLSNEEVHSFASSICQSSELVQAILAVFQERRLHNEFLEPVCHQLFSFYRSKESLLQLFTLQCVPSLVGLYLSSVSRGDSKSVKCVEVLLLGIYNLEGMDGNGKPLAQTFRIPSISKPSVFHEPMSLSQPALTENALSKLEVGDTVSIGPFPEVEKINASNRTRGTGHDNHVHVVQAMIIMQFDFALVLKLKNIMLNHVDSCAMLCRLEVLSVVLKVYNQHVGQLSPLCHHALCKTASRLAKQGYSRPPAPRIPLSATFLLELLHGVYFALFNGAATAGLQAMIIMALDDLHSRATQELLPSVLLATTAIRSSLRGNTDGPMGLAVSLSPSASSQAVSAPGKGLITNASFRTKKLPDDIPIMKEESRDGLSSIQEEGGEPVEKTTATARKNRRGSTSSIGSSSLLQIIKPVKKEVNGAEVDQVITKDGPKILFQANHTMV